MPDDPQDKQDKPIIEMPAAAVAATVSGTAFHFEVPDKPSCQQVIKLMAEQAKMINRMIASVTTTELLSAANPALASLFNASAQLESGAMQLHQLLVQQQQMAQGGLVGPGGGAAGQGPQRGPQRFN